MRWRALLLVLLIGGVGFLAWQTRGGPAAVGGAPGPIPSPGPAAVVAENGLVWEDLQVGTGAPPSQNRISALSYTAWNADGQVLASASAEDPLRFTYGTGEALPSFEQGIADMRVGGRRRLWIPGSLAYGGDGAPGIGPGTPLVFEVTLLDVNAQEEGPYPTDRNSPAP